MGHEPMRRKTAATTLVDERRAELMARLDELEKLRATGEGFATFSLELSLIRDEIAWLGRLLEGLLAESEERIEERRNLAALARLMRKHRGARP
jgi:hypothetical protein